MSGVHLSSLIASCPIITEIFLVVLGSIMLSFASMGTRLAGMPKLTSLPSSPILTLARLPALLRLRSLAQTWLLGNATWKIDSSCRNDLSAAL